MGLLRAFNLEKYMSEYGVNVFVETGTGIGEGLSHALDFPFDKCYSVEIIERLYSDAKSKFSKKSNCYLVNDNSISGLETILKSLSGKDRVLFWLDAHFPGADFGLGSYHDQLEKKIKTPLEDELRLIRSFRNNNLDVFLIDDLRMYEDGNYAEGSIDRKLYGGCDGIGFIYELFSKTHNITKDYRYQGALVITPLKNDK